MAVQQQIAAGNTEAMMGATRISHLEGELAEAKVGPQCFFFFYLYISLNITKVHYAVERFSVLIF